MKFNPLTKEIYSDKGEFVKTMNCPYKMSWDYLETTTSSNIRKCTNCDQLIFDTKYLTDDNLLKTVRQNPNICLKIDLNQNNLKIITNGLLEQK